MKRIRGIMGWQGRVVEKVEGIVSEDYLESDGESITDIRFTFTDGSTYSVGVQEPDYQTLMLMNDETWKYYEGVE